MSVVTHFRDLSASSLRATSEIETEGGAYGASRNAIYNAILAACRDGDEVNLARYAHDSDAFELRNSAGKAFTARGLLIPTSDKNNADWDMYMAGGALAMGFSFLAYAGTHASSLTPWSAIIPGTLALVCLGATLALANRNAQQDRFCNAIFLPTDKARMTSAEFYQLWNKKQFIYFRDPREAPISAPVFARS